MVYGYVRHSPTEKELASQCLSSRCFFQLTGMRWYLANMEYQDLGAEYFDRLGPERLRRYLVKYLDRLGYQVTLTTPEEAA